MINQNKSLTKGLQILKAIMNSNDPITANTLCQKFDIDKSTMSRLINTLIQEEFIEYKNNSKEIIAGDLVRRIIKKEDRDKLVEKSNAILDEIFYLTNECAYFGIIDNDSVLYLNQIDKSKRVLKTRNSIGMHAPLHSNAFGKILLAFDSTIDIDSLELTKFNSNTITSKRKLLKELEIIKEKGYAIGKEEHEFGLCSVAVPLFNKKNELIGTVGISGLSVRLNEQTLHRLGQEIYQNINKYN